MRRWDKQQQWDVPYFQIGLSYLIMLFCVDDLRSLESSQIGTFEIPARKAYPKNQPEKSFDQREIFEKKFFEEEKRKIFRRKSNDKKTEKLEIFKLLASDHWGRAQRDHPYNTNL